MLTLTPSTLLFTLFISCIFSPNHACNKNHERDSLLSFSLNLDSNPPLSWSSAIDCCQWEGIACDHDGCVTQIWLPFRGLRGNVSLSLGNLSSLSHLNLSHNSLEGSLTAGTFSYLKQLKILDLSYNSLSGDLSSNDWPASIKVIDISSNHFFGRIQSSYLQKAWNLTKFNVSNNSFTGPIPSFCNNSHSVKLLDFSLNDFTGQIPQGLGRCPKLEAFRAGFNFLSGVIPPDTYGATALREISLPFNRISGSISNDIVNLTKLTILELQYNELNGKLPLNIGKLSKLERLTLHTNFLTGSLPLSLMNCSNLNELILRFNFLEGNISTFNFSRLIQLTKLDLGSNKFTGTLPVSLFSCKSLTAIRLTQNQLEGQIPPEVLNLKFLVYFAVGNNKLTNITEAIKILMGCQDLEVAILAKNFLNEALPADENFLNSNGFQNLRILGLAACQLTGQLPVWISKLRKLEVLDLPYNSISGSIPGWLGTLPRLFYINLSYNRLSGKFPKELCRLPALVAEKATTLDYSYLKLPVFIQPMSENRDSQQYNRLTYLPPSIYIRSNNLSGNIPVEISHLRALHVLDLSNNNFFGRIPDQISILTDLERLNLSSNNLSGEIPTSLESLNFLNWFSVANNNLRGPIPQSVQLQSFSASAYEGNPELCGAPLPYLCSPTTKISNQSDHENWLGVPWFHLSVALGFITGFWAVCGPLLFHSSWRYAYFQKLENIGKTLYRTFAVDRKA